MHLLWLPTTGLVHYSSCFSKRWICDEGWRGDVAGVSESMSGRGSLLIWSEPEPWLGLKVYCSSNQASGIQIASSLSLAAVRRRFDLLAWSRCLSYVSRRLCCLFPDILSRVEEWLGCSEIWVVGIKCCAWDRSVVTTRSASILKFWLCGILCLSGRCTKKCSELILRTVRWTSFYYAEITDTKRSRKKMKPFFLFLSPSDLGLCLLPW